MPQFLNFGKLWINVDQITEVHVDTSKEGVPIGCKIKILGESARELSGKEIASAVLAFLQAHEYGPSQRPKGH